MAAIEKAMRGPHAQRAHEIRAAIGEGPQILAHRLRPHLKLGLCTASGSVFQPYANTMREGGVLDCDDGVIPIYAASECLIGIALDPQPNGQYLFLFGTLCPVL